MEGHDCVMLLIPTVVTLLQHCYCTLAALFQHSLLQHCCSIHCYSPVAMLLLHCCSIRFCNTVAALTVADDVAALLLHFCRTAAALLQPCCTPDAAVATLLVHFCYSWCRPVAALLVALLLFLLQRCRSPPQPPAAPLQQPCCSSPISAVAALLLPCCSAGAALLRSCCSAVAVPLQRCCNPVADYCGPVAALSLCTLGAILFAAAGTTGSPLQIQPLLHSFISPSTVRRYELAGMWELQTLCSNSLFQLSISQMMKYASHRYRPCTRPCSTVAALLQRCC